jgi:hypothetical protein
MKFRRPRSGNYPNFYLEQDPVTGLYRKCTIPRTSLSVYATVNFQMTELQLAGMILLMVIVAILLALGVFLDSCHASTFSLDYNATRNASQ